MIMKNLSYFAASYSITQAHYGLEAKPYTSLFGVDVDGRMFRGGELRDEVRPEYFSLYENFTKLKEYGVDVDSSGEIWDRFLKDFPPEKLDLESVDSKIVYGWMSPEGDIYACDTFGHSWLASDLRAVFQENDAWRSLSAETWLIDRGWIALRYGMVSIKLDVGDGSQIPTATDAQKARLRRLRELNVDEPKYLEGIDNFFELIDDTPKPKLIAPGRRRS